MYHGIKHVTKVVTTDAGRLAIECNCGLLREVTDTYSVNEVSMRGVKHEEFWNAYLPKE